MEYGWYVTDTYGGLSQEEKEYNASRAMTTLRQNGFTIYSAAGIVGNMWAESQMNPGQWQSGTPYSGGYGLVQWSPWSDYWPWPEGSTDWLNNGPRQMERILYERDNGLEFYPSHTYPTWTWRKYQVFEPEEGLTPTETVNVCASVFLYNYLRPSDPAGSEANRKYHARYVYEHCPGSVIPVWLLFKWSKLNRRILT